MSLSGICGSHRVGKSTLARDFAKKHGIRFLETPVSAIFRELGYEPSDVFDFKTRLDIQEVILERLDAIYASVPAGEQCITDRTPIDMLAYTMAEAVGSAVSEADQERFKRYADKCFSVVNKRFSTIVLLQPGIPNVEAPGKAVLNQAYIEHLNSLMLGLTVDERVRCGHFYIMRRMTRMPERIKALESALRQSNDSVVRQMESHVLDGGYLQ